MEPADQVSDGVPVHRWKPIEDLPADRAALSRAAAEVVALRHAWAGKKAELEESGALTEFNARLSRQWCIETGILEGIYTLDRGATTTLIEHGFDAARLSHGETNVGEQTLIRILRDHQDAIEGLFAFVKQDRPLTTSYVKVLHQILVAHQTDIEVLDGQGRLSRLPLRKGDWKLMPNNPGDPRTLELVHEYSPPEEVAAEMDRLIATHATHDSVEAEISAAWLHHRFVQIHPFQDGNGRVARALATLVLIQRGGFPLVVLRDDKNAYIDTLRAADDGDLLPLVEFVCRLQKKALLSAIEHGDLALASPTTITAIIQDAARRVRAAVPLADAARAKALRLCRRTHQRLGRVMDELRSSMVDVPDVTLGCEPQDIVRDGVYSDLINGAARQLGYRPDLEGSLLDVLLWLQVGRTWTHIRFAFHPIAGADSSVVAAIGLVSIYDQSRDAGQQAAVHRKTEPCCTEPFTFTAQQTNADITPPFDAWLEQSLTLGLEIWRRSL